MLRRVRRGEDGGLADRVEQRMEGWGTRGSEGENMGSRERFCRGEGGRKRRERERLSLFSQNDRLFVLSPFLRLDVTLLLRSYPSFFFFGHRICLLSTTNDLNERGRKRQHVALLCL